MSLLCLSCKLVVGSRGLMMFRFTHFVKPTWSVMECLLSGDCLPAMLRLRVCQDGAVLMQAFHLHFSTGASAERQSRVTSPGCLLLNRFLPSGKGWTHFPLTWPHPALPRGHSDLVSLEPSGNLATSCTAQPSPGFCDPADQCWPGVGGPERRLRGTWPSP